MPRETNHRAVVATASFVVLGLSAAAVRFLTTVGFNNDHFIHLTAAQQMLFGDWPTRDFIDVGRPLTIVASALVQRFVAQDLFAEAILVSGAFALAAVLTASTVLMLTGSLPLALLSALFELAVFPRSYSYPKLLASSLGLWLIARFLRRPTRARLAAMAVATVVAFLFRHDLGIFVGAGCLVASLLATPEAEWRDRWRTAGLFTMLTLALVLPYVAYVQVFGGLANYVRTMIEANSAEAGYVWPVPFSSNTGSDAVLLYVFHLLPMLAVGLCAWHWRHRRDWTTSFVIACTCVAVGENFGLMRDLLRARVPDAIVPASVLGAWLVSQGWHARNRIVRPVAVAAAIGAFVFAGQLGGVEEQFNRAGLSSDVLADPSLVAGLLADRATRLRDPFKSDPPSDTVVALEPFITYLKRCTTVQHRLFLAGMIPEVAYFAGRPFAGGAYEHFNFGSAANQMRVVDRLRREVVPFAFFPGDAAEELEDLPTVNDYIQSIFVPFTEVRVDEHLSVRILINPALAAPSRDTETGWPCWKSL